MDTTNSLSATSNYTEDDTFRILARPNIGEMKNILIDYRSAWHKGKGDKSYPTTENIVCVNQHGWGWTEYLIALKRYEGR